MKNYSNKSMRDDMRLTFRGVRQLLPQQNEECNTTPTKTNVCDDT